MLDGFPHRGGGGGGLGGHGEVFGNFRGGFLRKIIFSFRNDGVPFILFLLLPARAKARALCLVDLKFVGGRVRVDRPRRLVGGLLLALLAVGLATRLVVRGGGSAFVLVGWFVLLAEAPFPFPPRPFPDFKVDVLIVFLGQWAVHFVVFLPYFLGLKIF